MMAAFFGVDYYPEHWPEERWETDARLMKEMGLGIVRMGEFSWAKMEPAEGCFDFGWLDRAIDLLAEYGIETLLGTPTAAPPAWIIARNPEILPLDSQGGRKGFGGRHHDCQSNAAYRKHIRRFVTAMAEHFKDHPHVIGWQIDNELGNSHEDLCYCDDCRDGFQRWLKKKYETIDRVNREWGTAFWSQDYDRFEQIPAPRAVPTRHNPSLLLDWARFCSDLVVDFNHFQVEIIRAIAPRQAITHNLMGLYDKTDYFKLAQDLDFVSNDQYPTGYYFMPPGQSAAELSACLDLMRGLKQQNFWMMELQAGATGGHLIGRTPRPGQLRLWTAHCLAHGADTVVYFRWRTCLFGTEQYWHGILPHDGRPQRRYQELRETIREMTPILQDIAGIVTGARVAIVFSYDQSHAFKIQPHHPDLDYIEQVKLYYESFYQHNIAVDFIDEKELRLKPDITGEQDLPHLASGFRKYQLVLAPLQFLMEAEREEWLRQYVADGGTLVLTMRTGVKNMNNVCMSEHLLPGRLQEILGLTVAEYDCLPGLTVDLQWQDPPVSGTANKWCDILELTGAQPLAYYQSEYYRQQPAITVNQYGKGRAYYVGTEPDRGILNQLTKHLLKTCALVPEGTSPADVELTVRRGQKQDYLFAVNHNEGEQLITLNGKWEPLQPAKEAPGNTGHSEKRCWLIAGYGVTVFTVPAAR